MGDIAAPSGDLAQVNGIALIFWGIFEARFGSGVGGVALMIIPLGCACFCALLSLTSASRCMPVTCHQVEAVMMYDLC